MLQRPNTNHLPFAEFQEGRFHWSAVTARGIEEMTAAEIRGAGATEVEPGRALVRFQADLATAYRLHRKLRTASRVLWPFRDFAARDSVMLYDQIRRLPWESLIRPSDTFAVECTVSGSEDFHTRFAALKIKDAIVDRIREKRGSRPNIDVENPIFRLFAHFTFQRGQPGPRCSLSLDATGGSLHERGYRPAGTLAPLRETLAAALVDLSGWTLDEPLLDPMCGSGTIVIEAARKLLGVPNGGASPRFLFMNWPNYDIRRWRADSDAIAAAPASPLIFGSDSSQKALAQARLAARAGGVETAVRFEAQELARLKPPSDRPGVILTNPPYGERVGEVSELKDMYHQLGSVLRERFGGWRLKLLSGNPELSAHLGLKASKRDPLFNGKIECRLLHYDLRPRSG